MIIQEQQDLHTSLNRIFEIFIASDAALRPHFVLTGSSGTGKTHLIKHLCDEHEVNYFEVNAAQLTKEGVSGNSLSKALAPLRSAQGLPCVCFVDEFDKLFISGNCNSDMSHESCNGVQNEFLKVLESETASVFGDYGKYTEVAVDKVLFVFAGAFNGEDNIDLDRLRELGIKTEFLGRVGLVYNTKRISLNSLINVLERSKVLANYLELFPEVKRSDALKEITKHLSKNHEKNTLGVRMVNTLITQYFINGGKLPEKIATQSTFQRTLSFSK